MSAFLSSVSAETPPADVGPALQALWWALRAVGIKDPVRGYGRLLTS
jgi:hypothetical protein